MVRHLCACLCAEVCALLGFFVRKTKVAEEAALQGESYIHLDTHTPCHPTTHQQTCTYAALGGAYVTCQQLNVFTLLLFVKCHLALEYHMNVN